MVGCLKVTHQLLHCRYATIVKLLKSDALVEMCHYFLLRWILFNDPISGSDMLLLLINASVKRVVLAMEINHGKRGDVDLNFTSDYFDLSVSLCHQ